MRRIVGEMAEREGVLRQGAAAVAGWVGLRSKAFDSLGSAAQWQGCKVSKSRRRGVGRVRRMISGF